MSEKVKGWLTPIIVVALLIGSGFLAVIIPAANRALQRNFSGESTSYTAEAVAEEEEPIEDNISRYFYILGDEYIKPFTGWDGTISWSAERAIVYLSGAVLGGIFALTLPIMGLMILTDRITTNNKNSATYQQNATALEKELAAQVKRLSQERPPTAPSAVMPRWSVISTTLVFMLLAYFGGYTLGEAISHGVGRPFGYVLAILVLVLAVLNLRPAVLFGMEKTDNLRPPAGVGWVMLSGGLVVGLGLGLMFVVISGNDPFPFIDWTQTPPTFNWEWIELNIFLPLS